MNKTSELTEKAEVCDRCGDTECPSSSTGSWIEGSWTNDTETLLADVVCVLQRIANSLSAEKQP